MNESLGQNELSDLIAESLNEIAEEASDEDAIREGIEEFYDELGEVMYEETVENMDEQLAEWRNELTGFHDRLYDDWDDPIDLLEVFILYSRDLGIRLHNQVGEDARKDDDILFLTLMKLHGRAIQVSQEILTLIKNGFADGAHARWRALHEIAVVATFIKRTGNESAKRFLLHEWVDTYHLKKHIHEYEGTGFLGEVSEGEVDEAKETVELLCDEFGDEFGGLWGWAAHEISNPTFRNLEEAVDMDHFRPYYDFASKVNVHSGAMGASTQIGMFNRKYLSASGPTNAGFHLPGFSTAISLHQITISFLSHILLAETLADFRVMEELVDDIYHAFMSSQEKIEQKDREATEQFIEDLDENPEEILKQYEPVDPSEYEISIQLDRDSP